MLCFISFVKADYLRDYYDLSLEASPTSGDIVLRELAHGWKNSIVGHLGHVGIVVPDNNFVDHLLGWVEPKVLEVMERENRNLAQINSLTTFQSQNPYIGFSHLTLNNNSSKKLIKTAFEFQKMVNSKKYGYTLQCQFVYSHNDWKKVRELSLKQEYIPWYYSFWWYHSKKRSIKRRNRDRKNGIPRYGYYWKSKKINGLTRCDTFVAMVYKKSINKSLSGFKYEGNSKYAGWFFPKDIYNSLKTFPANRINYISIPHCVDYIVSGETLTFDKYTNSIRYYTKEEVINGFYAKINNQSYWERETCSANGYNRSEKEIWQ